MSSISCTPEWLHSIMCTSKRRQHDTTQCNGKTRCRARDHLLLFKRATHCALSSSSAPNSSEPRIQLKIGRILLKMLYLVKTVPELWRVGAVCCVEEIRMFVFVFCRNQFVNLRLYFSSTSYVCQVMESRKSLSCIEARVRRMQDMADRRHPSVRRWNTFSSFCDLECLEKVRLTAAKLNAKLH